MGLLENLGLKPTRAMLKPPPMRVVPKPLATPPAVAAIPVAPVASDPPSTRGAADGDVARQAALAMQGEMKARQAAAQAEWAKLADGQEKLAAAIAAAQGAKKAELEASKKLLDRRLAEVGKTVDRVNADVEALQNPATNRAEYVAILARAKAQATVGKQTDIDTHDEVIDKKAGNRHETKTTTSYADGKAVTTTEDQKRTVGLGGVTQSASKVTEQTTADSSVKRSEEKTTQVSVKGLTIDEKSSTVVERDGKKVSASESSSTAIGKDGVMNTSTSSLTKSDNTTSATTTTGGVERGDGKASAVVGKTTTDTDASGTATSKGGKGKIGGVAGDKGYGGAAEGTGTISREALSGLKAGAVAGLNSNVVCNIGEPAGDPPLYPLTLEVNLGGSITLSAGHARREGPAAVGVEAKVGATVFMRETRQLTPAQAAKYVEALKEASAGGTVAGTHKEFAIIQAGVKEGWKVAQAMYKSGGKPLSAQALARLRGVGDSTEIGGGKTVGGKANVSVKAFSLEASGEESTDHSTKVTRNKEGTLDVDMNAGATSKRAGKMGVSSGMVGGSAGRSHSVRTTAGYQITIDPKNDPDGKMFEALAACSDPADYEAFLATYGKRVTVKGKTVGKAVVDTEEVGLDVGPAKLRLGLHAGVAEETSTDAKGKLKRRKVVGSAGGGGSLEIAGKKIGDSSEDEAVADIDGDGNASVDLSRKTKGTDFGKFVRANVPLMGDKKKGGVLAKATGGDGQADTDSQDVAGIRLSNKDLDALGEMACNDWSKWMHCPTSHTAIPDWEKAGRLIKATEGDRRAVADQLAKFIGGDKSNRLDMVNLFLRPRGKVGTGVRYEFPDGLEVLKKDYDAYVIGAGEAIIESTATSEGAEKAGTVGKNIFDAIDNLYRKIEAAKNFSQPAVRAEMLSAINARKQKVLAAMRKNAGGKTDASKADQEAEYHRVLKACVQYESSQNDLFALIKELDRPGGDYVKAAHTFKQLGDLQAVWGKDYEKAAALGKEIGKPEATYSKFQPNLGEYDRLYKHWRIQGT